MRVAWFTQIYQHLNNKPGHIANKKCTNDDIDCFKETSFSLEDDEKTVWGMN